MCPCVCGVRACKDLPLQRVLIEVLFVLYVVISFNMTIMRESEALSPLWIE